MESNMIAQKLPPRHEVEVVIGALLTLFAGMLLIGQHFAPGLLSRLPDIESVSPLTALYLLLCGGALLASQWSGRIQPASIHLIIGISLCLLSLAALTNLLPLPELFAARAPTSNISLAFFCAGLLLIIGQQASSSYSISLLFLLLILVCAFALLGGIGLALGFDPIFGWSEQAHMTAYTVCGLLLFAFALTHNLWQRIRHITIDPLHGISAVTGILVLFIAVAVGIVIYSVAAANIYQTAKNEMHRTAHDRAERIFIEQDMALLRLQTLMTRLSASASLKQLNTISLADNRDAFIQIIDGTTGERTTLGTAAAGVGPEIAHSYPGLSLRHVSDNGLSLKQEMLQGDLQITAEMPLHLSALTNDDVLNGTRYTLHPCIPGRVSADAGCRLEAKHANEHFHSIPEHWQQHGKAEPPSHHLGIFHDLSDGDTLAVTMHLPELQMVLLITRNVQAVFGPLYHEMLYGIPIIFLMFISGISFAAWRITPLVRTMQDNERRFRVLAENANDLIALHDLEGKLLYVSPACQLLLGYREEQVVGRSAYDFIHPDDIASVRQSHDILISTVEMPRAVYRVRRNTGDYLWFETTGRLSTSEDGSSAEIITVSRDITAQYSATEELRLSELKYRTLVDQASDAIILQDTERRFIEVNQAACEMFGYERDELIGMHPDAFLLAEEVKDARERREEMRLGTVASRRQLRRRDGTLVTVDIHATGIEGGGIISLLRDIGEQLRIEQALHDSRERWRSLVETAPDTIMSVNREGELLFINRGPSGLTREESIGRNVLDFVSPKHHATVRDAIARVYAGEEHVDYEIEAKGDNGDIVWWSSACGPVYHDGHIESVIIVSRNISERHRMELALRNSEQRNRSVVEVLAEGIVVHDRNGNIISSNRAAQQILGRSNDSPEDLTLLDFEWDGIHEDGTVFPAASHPAMVAFATGRSQRDVIMGVMRPDDERVWISVNSEPIWDDGHDEILSVVSSFSDITEQRRAETALRESRERLRALTIHLQEIREEEKAMIAREVHDELGSTMTALKLSMSWLENRIVDAEPMVAEKLSAMSRLLEQAVNTVRRLVTQLRPTILEDLGLWAALEWQLREFAQYSQIQVSDNLQQQVLMVNRVKALAIYRVLQEALTNIAKHSAARKVRLDCWERDGILHIMLEDDGVGISENTTMSPTSHGLRGMYERISSVGGMLEILSTPGEGTVITIEIPHN
jgi:PAS domain S-box-containing protein